MFIRGMAEDEGLDVVFGSDPGYHRDSHTIYLPAYARFSASQLAADPSVQAMQEAVSDLFLATGFHEFGHPAYTTPGFRNSGDLGDFLWNALEDVRCDSIQQRRFAGAKRIFNAGYGRLIRMGFWTPPDPSDLQGVFSSWVLYQARAVLAEQECFEDLGRDAESVMHSLAGPVFVADAWAIVSKVREATCTKDVFDIVNELLAFLQQQASSPEQSKPQPQPPSQGANSDSSEQTGGSQEPAKAEDPGKDQSGQQTAGDASGTPGKEKPQSGQPPKAGDDSSGKSQGAGSSQGSPDPHDQPGSNGAPQGASAQADKPQGGSGQRPGDAAGDPSKVAGAALGGPGTSLPKDVGSVLSQALDGVTSDAAASGADAVTIPRARRAQAASTSYMGDGDSRVLTIRLRNLLLAQARVQKSYDRRGSRACPRMLARLPFGERDVFVDEKRAALVDTAIKVVVDRSQSMQVDRRIQVARAAALRVTIALGDIAGTNVSASAFPERLDGRSDQVRQLLPFGAKPRQFARNFLDLDAPDWATTPMAPALTLALFELLRQRQPRKVCLVVTDGAPNGGGAREKEVVAQMRRCGIQVLGLGITKMHCPDLFDKFEVVHDLAGLESAMFRLLQSAMLNRIAA